jgi:N-acetylmuramoyl-L-alanine amidase
MAKLKFLVLHCTATPEGMAVTAEMIKHWHTDPVPQGRGWTKVGYSDLIALDGTLINLTPYNQDDDVQGFEVTNGALGINAISRHIVYAGGLAKDGKTAKDTRTHAQLLAMGNYVKQVVQAHPTILVAGHNQFANKACPSFNVVKYLTELSIPAKNIYKP